MAFYRRHLCTLDPWPDFVQRSIGEIDVPTLITVGRHDEITPACAETLHHGIAGSRIHVFERSAHIAHAEESGLYLSVVGDFQRSAERANGD